MGALTPEGPHCLQDTSRAEVLFLAPRTALLTFNPLALGPREDISLLLLGAPVEAFCLGSRAGMQRELGLPEKIQDVQLNVNFRKTTAHFSA